MPNRIVYLTEGGGDDFASTVLIVPPDVDVPLEMRRWRAWYDQTYLPTLQTDTRIPYMGRMDWLIERAGCRRPTDQEVEWFELD